jgi:hypothetical protein
MTGQDSKMNNDSERRIEANLKKVYEESMNEPMSDQLANLVAQLREKTQPGNGGAADG